MNTKPGVLLKAEQNDEVLISECYVESLFQWSSKFSDCSAAVAIRKCHFN